MSTFTQEIHLVEITDCDGDVIYMPVANENEAKRWIALIAIAVYAQFANPDIAPEQLSYEDADTEEDEIDILGVRIGDQFSAEIGTLVHKSLKDLKEIKE